MNKFVGIGVGALGGVLASNLAVGLVAPFMVSAECNAHMTRMAAEQVDIYRPNANGDMTADQVRAQECLRPLANVAVGTTLLLGFAGGVAGARLASRGGPRGPR